MPGRIELPPREGVAYTAFCDPSGGASDSMTLGIAHNEDGVAVLDALREVRPPFSPEQVVEEFVSDLRRFGVTVVHGDKYGAEWVREQFTKKTMVYRHADKSKSDIHNELIPLINSGGARLLDNERLLVQLANLERRVVRGGKSSIDHPRGLHDDLANAAAGALVYAASASFTTPEFVWDGIPLMNGKAARRELAEQQVSVLPSTMNPSINTMTASEWEITLRSLSMKIVKTTLKLLGEKFRHESADSLYVEGDLPPVPKGVDAFWFRVSQGHIRPDVPKRPKLPQMGPDDFDARWREQG